MSFAKAGGPVPPLGKGKPFNRFEQRAREERNADHVRRFVGPVMRAQPRDWHDEYIDGGEDVVIEQAAVEVLRSLGVEHVA